MSGENQEHEPARSTAKRLAGSSILKFAGMGIQLAVAIGLGALAGLRLDEHLAWEQPLGTAFMSLLGLAVGMYQVLRALR